MTQKNTLVWFITVLELLNNDDTTFMGGSMSVRQGQGQGLVRKLSNEITTMPPAPEITFLSSLLKNCPEHSRLSGMLICDDDERERSMKFDITITSIG